MPFSRSRTWTASTISFDIDSALQQVASIDVRVRDRHDAGVGGDRDLCVGGTDELPREALAAAVVATRANACAAADEASEVIRLRQRTLGAGRRHLEPVLREQVAQVAGHALAGCEVHSAVAVDEQADLAVRDLLG